MIKVPFAGRVYDDKEVMAAVKASIAFWLTAGPETIKFEKALAETCETKHALFVNSGSSASLLAFETMKEVYGLKRGDRVLTTALGFPTTIAPMLQCGIVPVFVDVSRYNANVALDQLEGALDNHGCCGAVLAHTLGVMFDVKAVRKALGSSRFLVEDACDALGSSQITRDGTLAAGSQGDISTLSFYPAHHCTTGEGGAVLSKVKNFYDIARSYRDWGRDCSCETGEDGRCGERFSGKWGTLPKGYDHKYVYSRLGYNLKATDIQAAIGNVQITRLHGFTAKRRENRDAIVEALKVYKAHGLIRWQEETLDEDTNIVENVSSWFGVLLVVTTDKIKRLDFIRYLEDRGIQTRLPFAGNMVRQPVMQKLKENSDYIIHDALEFTDEFCMNSFFVGCWPGMTKEQRDWLITCLTEFLDQYV